MQLMINRQCIIDGFKEKGTIPFPIKRSSGKSTIMTRRSQILSSSFESIGYPTVDTDMEYLTFSNKKCTVSINEHSCFCYDNNTFQILLLTPEEQEMAVKVQQKIKFLEYLHRGIRRIV